MMTTRRLTLFVVFVVLAVLPSVLAGQEHSPEKQRTEVRGHVMGESLTEYLDKVGHGGEIAACQELLRRKINKREREHGEYCQKLLQALKGSRIELPLLPQLPAADGMPETSVVVFENGKLAVVQINVQDKSLDSLMPDMIRKYGAMKSRGVMESSGGEYIDWVMPDGTHILVASSGYLGGAPSWMHSTQICFSSREENERTQTEKAARPSLF